MNSRKESKQLRAEKSIATRRNILRLGALGAAAVLVANVIPGADVRAATDTRSVAKMGTQKALHVPAGGRTARSAATVKTQGALATRKAGSTMRATKQASTKAATKAAKAAAGERQPGTRQTAQAAAKKAAKVMAQ